MTCNILIVDDELSLRELLRDVLNDAGYQTEVAPSAEEALEIMEHYKPEVIVSDIWMPGMNGHDFCKKVRETSDASILMMSGVSSEFSKLQRMQVDADDFLIKPFDVENFLERIEALREKRRKPVEQVEDAESRLLHIFQALPKGKRESVLKEAERLSESD